MAGSVISNVLSMFTILLILHVPLTSSTISATTSSIIEPSSSPLPSISYGPAGVVGNRIYFQGQPFFVKGICYSPAPMGDNPVFNKPYGDYYTPEYRPLWERDLPLIKEMGANTLRLYGWGLQADHSAFLDYAQSQGLAVIITYYMGTAQEHPIDTEENQQKTIDRFTAQVRKYRGHPAILAWSFGNEINGDWNNFLQQVSDANQCRYNPSCVLFSTKSVDANANPPPLCKAAVDCTYSHFFSFIDRAAEAAHKAMEYDDIQQDDDNSDRTPPSAFHLITSSFADVDLLLERIEVYGQDYLPHLDMYGAQIYRGRDFAVPATADSPASDFLTDFSAITPKPLVVTEFGVDAYNDPCGTSTSSPCYNDVNSPPFGFGEDELTQADWNSNLASLLMQKSSAAEPKLGGVAGGCIMAWVDEMWKSAVNVKGCKGSPAPFGQPGFDPSKCDHKAHVRCPSVDIEQPSLCGYFLGSTFDKYVNEGWFGIMKVHESMVPGQVDVLTPRKQFFAIQQVWRDGPLPDTWMYLTAIVALISVSIVATLVVVLVYKRKVANKLSQELIDMSNNSNDCTTISSNGRSNANLESSRSINGGSGEAKRKDIVSHVRSRNIKSSDGNSSTSSGVGGGGLGLSSYQSEGV